MSMIQKEASASNRVNVWLDCSSEPPTNDAEVMHVITCITGDWQKAYELISGRHNTSVAPWKGIVTGAISHDAARLIVQWLDTVGA